MSVLYPILIGVGTGQALCILLWTLLAWGPQFITEPDPSPGENPGCNEGGTGREITDGTGKAQELAGARRTWIYLQGGVSRLRGCLCKAVSTVLSLS